MPGTAWSSAQKYEPYVGRWSRRIAPRFVDWLDVPPGRRWLDVGCGTGALSSAILAAAQPQSVVGVDPSAPFVEQAQADNPDAAFQVGDAQELPLEDDSVDVTASALVLNFVPDPQRAIAEMRRVCVPGGTIAAYVWDYADGMQMIRLFFDAAIALHQDAAQFDEGRKFPLCQPGPLEQLLAAAGLTDIKSRAIEVPAVFTDFDDYWTPFLSGQAPAPAYCASLSETDRTELRERLRDTLPTASDGSISLIARSWAVRGTAPDYLG